MEVASVVIDYQFGPWKIKLNGFESTTGLKWQHSLTLLKPVKNEIKGCLGTLASNHMLEA